MKNQESTRSLGEKDDNRFLVILESDIIRVKKNSEIGVPQRKKKPDFVAEISSKELIPGHSPLLDNLYTSETG